MFHNSSEVLFVMRESEFCFSYAFFFFGGVWTQDFLLSRQTLLLQSYLQPFFLWFSVERGIHIFPQAGLDCDPPILYFPL
jgi:hypothetical protein